MSYSKDLKSTLREIGSRKKCCRHAFRYGEELFSANGEKRQKTDWKKYGYSDGEDPSYIRTENFRCQSCKGGFMCGVFCSAGTVSDPEKSFHFEIRVKNPVLADNLLSFLSNNGIEMKTTTRNNCLSLYLKKGDDIGDMLHFMGAGKEAFEITNEKIRRDFSNLANRRSNFEVVNIGKTVTAAGKTIDAIKKLQKKGRLSVLPKGLEETANLRLENPFANLEELAALHSDRISKSGVNHRLKKLIELSEED